MDLAFRKKEKAVGLFIIITVFMSVMSLFLIGRGKGWFKHYITYYAIFQETYNLQAGAPVKLYNAEIGRVKKIELVEDQVKVSIQIVEDYVNRVKESSYVTVQSPTFIGSEFIALITGDKKSALIPDGGRIKSVEKKSISDIMADFQVEKTAKKVVEAVQELTDMVHKLNSSNGPVFTVLNDIAKIVSDIEKGKGNVGEILRTRNITKEIEKRLAQVESILANVNKAVSKTPETMDIVNNSLKKVDRIGTNIEDGTKDILAIIADLKESIKKVDNAISNIENGSRKVPEITDVTLKGLEEIRIGVKKIDNTVESLQKSFLIRGNLPKRTEPSQFKPDSRP